MKKLFIRGQHVNVQRPVVRKHDSYETTGGKCVKENTIIIKIHCSDLQNQLQRSTWRSLVGYDLTDQIIFLLFTFYIKLPEMKVHNRTDLITYYKLLTMLTQV